MAKASIGERLRSFAATKKGKIILGIVLLLVALRLALPFIVLRYANRALANMDGYYGHIQDVDIYLFRGAYTLDSIYLNKVSKSGDQSEFFSAHTIDLSVEWRALFKGRVVGELIFDQPRLKFTKNRVELDEVSKDTTDFRELLNRLMPIQVNRAEIRNGTLMYLDPGARPKVDIAVTNFYALATNLKNAYKSTEVLPADLQASGNVYGGTMNLNIKMNPLAEQTTLDLNAQLKNTNLPDLNDFFKAYANLDIAKGKFDMYTEIATKNGKFRGYVKPLIRDLDVVEWKTQDKNDSFFQKVWESLAGGVGKLFENKNTDQVATKVEFEGDLDSPSANVLQAVVTVLQNAFIRALRPSVDNEINIQNIEADDKQKKGFFKQLFEKDKDKKESNT